MKLPLIRAVAALVLALACDGLEREEATHVASPTLAPEVVTLLEPGQEPRSALRYAIPADLEVEGSFLVQGLRVVRDGELEPAPRESSLQLELRAGPAQRSIGATELELEVVGKAVGEEAERRVDRLQAETERALETAPVRLGFDARGITLAPGRAWPDARLANPFLLALLGSVQGLLRPIPLPEAPIGLGAFWEVHRVRRIGGVEVTEVARYRITQLAVDQMRVTLYLRQTASPQSATTAAGRQVELRSFYVEIDGGAVLDLTTPLPLDIDAGLNAAIAIQPGAGGVAAVEQQNAMLRVFVPVPGR